MENWQMFGKQVKSKVSKVIVYSLSSYQTSKKKEFYEFSAYTILNSISLYRLLLEQ